MSARVLCAASDTVPGSHAQRRGNRAEPFQLSFLPLSRSLAPCALPPPGPGSSSHGSQSLQK